MPPRKATRPRSPKRLPASIDNPPALLLGFRRASDYAPVYLSATAAGAIWRGVVAVCGRCILQRLRDGEATPAELRDVITKRHRGDLLALREALPEEWQPAVWDLLVPATTVALGLMEAAGVVEKVDRWAGGRKPGRRWAWRILES